MCLGVSEPKNGWLSRVQQTALCITDKVNRHLSKKMTKNKKMKKNEKKKSKSVKSLRYMPEFFSRLYPTNDYLLLENCQLYIIAKYKLL